MPSRGEGAGRIRFRPVRGRHTTVRRHLDLPFGTDADDVQPDLLFRVAERDGHLRAGYERLGSCEAKQRKKRAAATSRHSWTVARIGPGQPAQLQAAEVEVSLQMRETPEQLLKWLSSGIHWRRPYKRRHNPCIQ
jgi:hypothetical protein